jgi:hypothetical protein
MAQLTPINLSLYKGEKKTIIFDINTKDGQDLDLSNRTMDFYYTDGSTQKHLTVDKSEAGKAKVTLQFDKSGVYPYVLKENFIGGGDSRKAMGSITVRN